MPANHKAVRGLLLTTLLAAAGRSQQQPEPLPAFEVASVRITPPANFGVTTFGPRDTNRYILGNATLDFLIQVAYGIPFPQISGIEKLGSEHYEISAKAEDGVLLTNDNLRPRLRRLLADRFKLAVHREEKEFDGYALVVAKGGPKLQPTSGSSEQGAVYPGGLRIFNAPVKSLALLLRIPAGRPVMDKTGIEGKYDFKLTYAREGDADSPLPSFFTALQETFGLKLEPAKVPLEIVVIDHVEKIPTEN